MPLRRVTQPNDPTAILPGADGLDTGALARLFSNTTSSYKFLFFIALLNRINSKTAQNGDDPISLRDIVGEMAGLAWVPSRFFKLSFGAQDRMPLALDRLNFPEGELYPKKFPAVAELTMALFSDDTGNELLRYVPYRLIRVFFEAELRGVPDKNVNQRLLELAHSEFASRKPLYRFDASGESIIVHPDWADYLRRNFTVVSGWAAWNWLGYMQRCNPNVPALSSKLFRPGNRESLSRQTQYWKEVCASTELRCIYSGQILGGNGEQDFALDHFIPWTFVAHDQLWNLIPVHPSANSSKGNCLPSTRYLEPFIEMQHVGIMRSHERLKSAIWLKRMEPFVADLKLGDANLLLNPSILTKAYLGTVPPLIAIAGQQGFSQNWQYLDRGYRGKGGLLLAAEPEE
jgi:hypothetical protein